VSKIELGLKIAAISMLGGMAISCDDQDKPQFDNCSFDSANQSKDFYLRTSAAHSNKHLVIGDYDFQRDKKTGQLVKKVGDELVIMSPNTFVPLPIQQDGRLYDITFQDMDIYIKATVNTSCPQ
jgi:hypothetical protein